MKTNVENQTFVVHETRRAIVRCRIYLILGSCVSLILKPVNIPLPRHLSIDISSLLHSPLFPRTLRSSATFHSSSSTPSKPASATSIKRGHIPHILVISLHFPLTTSKSVPLVSLFPGYLLSSSVFCRSVKFHIKIVLCCQCITILAF